MKAGEARACGSANRFMLFEPLAGRRQVQATAHRTKLDFAHVIRDLVEVHDPNAEKIVLVMDNLNTHKPASLYEAVPPAEARRLIEKLEIHNTQARPLARQGGNGTEHPRETMPRPTQRIQNRLPRHPTAMR